MISYYFISQWDQSCVLKKNPMVLRGGYQDFMRKYPMCTTQALNFDRMTNFKLNPVVTDLSGTFFFFVVILLFFFQILSFKMSLN